MARGDVSSNVGADVDEINQTREAMFGAFNAMDLDRFVAPVADDVVWMSHSGPPPTVGKSAVRSSYKEFFERGPFIPILNCSSDEVIVSGDWAFDRGTWVVLRTYKRGLRRERLKSCYLMIWRRAPAGTWKLARLIWNGAPVPMTVVRRSDLRGRPEARRRK